MSFIALIFKNLVRQRVRTVLTVLGISIGITTVVALGVVTESLKATSGEIITLGGADFMVAQEGAADLSFSTISEDDEAAIAALPGVERAIGALFHIARVGSNPFFFVIGMRPGDIAENPPPLKDGELYQAAEEDTLILGSRAAEDGGLDVGDTITIEHTDFQIVGIYHTGTLYEDSGAMVALSDAQAMASKTGVVTAVFVKAANGTEPEDLAALVEEQFPNLATIASIDDYGKVDQGIRFLDAANLAISLLAVGIGAIGVMNTMVMSVFERTREIGILRAVGWSGNRILRMIFGESIILCALATVVGSLLGVLAIQLLLMIDMIRNLLEPQYTIDVFVRAIVLALIVALLGAAYPAFHAVRQTPMDALRYE